MAITNRHLVIILSWVIVISLFGTMISLTQLGRVPYLTGTVTRGITNLSVSTSIAVNFTTSNLTWGKGQVSPGFSRAILDTFAGSVTGGNWTAEKENFTIRNVGNVDINVTMNNSMVNGTKLIRGTSPGYNMKIFEPRGNDSSASGGSCHNATGKMFGNLQWMGINGSAKAQDIVAPGGETLCENLSFRNQYNYLYIALRLYIPSDSKKGVIQDNWTISATRTGS